MRVLAVQVEAPSGTVLYDQKGLQSGQFAFTTKEDGDFKACFTAKGIIMSMGVVNDDAASEVDCIGLTQTSGACRRHYSAKRNNKAGLEDGCGSNGDAQQACPPQLGEMQLLCVVCGRRF